MFDLPGGQGVGAGWRASTARSDSHPLILIDAAQDDAADDEEDDQRDDAQPAGAGELADHGKEQSGPSMPANLELMS